MKSLILILLVGIAAQAQTIADIARQERAKKQGKAPSARVLTNEDLKRPQAAAAAVAAAVPQAKEAATPATPATPAKVAEPVKPAASQPDPVQAWNAEIAALRTTIRELQDKETATQLQVAHQANKVYAPVTSVRERNEAQAALGAAQKSLVSIREEIVATRLKLEQLQTRGLEQLQTRGPARN